MSLIGTLKDVKLADVLRLMASGKKSGRLMLSAEAEQAVIRFQKGAIVQASAGRRLQGEDAVFDLFGWREGQITFVPDEREVAPNVTKPVDALILEGLRVGDTLHRMNVAIPSDRVIFQWGPGPDEGSPPLAVSATEWRVLRLLDGTRDVGEVAEAACLPRSEAVRTLFELLEARLVEKVEPAKSLRVMSQGLTSLFAGKDTAEIDERPGEEWRKILRFASGVHRVEVRTPGGRTAAFATAFRPGLLRDIHLPRGAIAELGVREGDEVLVKPLA